MRVHIIFRGAMLEHWETAEASQFLYLQIHKNVAMQSVNHLNCVKSLKDWWSYRSDDKI
jgi:hypothetical protein